MKKLIIAAIAIVAFTTTSFAGDGSKKASYWVINQFTHTYADATNVTWQVTDQFAKATFLLNEVKVEAYYNQEDGSFIGQSKAVSTQELPLGTTKQLAKKYSDYVIKEVIEFSNTTDVDFYVSMENATTKLVLKISRAGEISVFKSIQK
jgi:hypothetical protein